VRPGVKEKKGCTVYFLREFSWRGKWVLISCGCVPLDKLEALVRGSFPSRKVHLFLICPKGVIWANGSDSTAGVTERERGECVLWLGAQGKPLVGGL
jgi:hypothetical protein